MAHVFSYLADAATDINALMAARAVRLPAELEAGEIGSVLMQVMAAGSAVTITTAHATLAQVRAALRSAYAGATRLEAIMLGDYLASLTDGDLRTLFGLSAAQVTALRTSKLMPAANAAAAIRAAAGG